MNRFKVTSMICGGILSLATTGLVAQQSSSSGQSSSSTAGQTYGSSSSASTFGAQAGQSQNVRLGQLLHASVQSKDGKQLGHIRDFTVDPQSGRIQFAILSLGAAGAMGSTTGTSSSTTETPSSTAHMGTMGKLIPVPWQLFSQSWSGSHLNTGATGVGAAAPTLVLNVDQAKLESAPSLQGNNWNELQQSSFDQQVYSYFGVSQNSATGMPGSSVSGQGTSGWKNQGTKSQGTHPYGSSTQPQR